MSLLAGQRLGVYEVVAPLGAGGMGEVYRARDTRLHREVALKILPDVFAFDPDRLARFDREAQLLAALNHPNIAAIYGLEESGATKALALELVEGPTLDDRIAEGPIPVAEALAIARQIVDALEAAHEAGIVHRDLKPANIKLRPDGTVKVLDFGLAKLATSGSSLTPGVTASPTITTPAVTGIGTILGTAAYMAPEQARGKVVDKRADIWAFGCVLFEMLTGTRAFDGDDATVVVASIIKSDVQWSALPPDTPAAVRTVLHGCLDKDPKKRIRDIGDVRLALDGSFIVTPEAVVVATATHGRGGRRALPLVAGVLAGAALAGLAAWALIISRDPQPAPATQRFTLALPDTDLLPPGTGTLVAISPDGQTLVYRAQRDGVFRLFRRRLDQLEAVPIGEPNASGFAFFSADGQWLGYAVENTLKKTLLSGGPSQTVTALPAAIRSASWNDDGTILLGGTSAGLLQVPAAGGTAELVAKPDRGQVWYPQLLPGTRAVLFTSSQPAVDAGELEVLRLDTGERRTLLPGVGARYVSTGHLLFARGTTLWAVRFDLGTLAVVGTPVPVMEGVRIEGGGAIQFSVADNGSLVYIGGQRLEIPRRLVWTDRQGRAEPLPAPTRNYQYPRLSPDGTRIALDVGDEEQDIWIWDLARATLTRLTFGGANESYPAWTPDGRRVIYSSTREAGVLFAQSADGTGAAERLEATLGRTADQTVVSPDQKRLLFRSFPPSGGAASEDVASLSLDGERRVESLLNGPATERNAEVSPDGRWIAYQSNESGTFEVYVRPFPRVNDGRWQISTGGGLQPLWSPDGRELFYLAPQFLMSVPVRGGATFTPGNPTRVIDVGQYSLVAAGRSYDVSHDGRRFLMIRDETPEGRAEIQIVINWFEELKRLVPTD